MKVTGVTADGANVELSVDELDLLRNGLNEARLLISEAEFDTRLGSYPSEADTLIRALKSHITEVIDARDSAKPEHKPKREQVKS
jgi:hypothetical protein